MGFSCLVRLLLDWYRCTSRPACFSTMARASASLCIISTSHMHVQPRWQRGRPCCPRLASCTMPLVCCAPCRVWSAVHPIHVGVGQVCKTCSIAVVGKPYTSGTHHFALVAA